MSAQQVFAAKAAFAAAMKRERFPLECVVTGDWPIESALKAYDAAKPLESDDRQEAVCLLLKWCGLFFGRNGAGEHMSNETYNAAHTKLFIETSDWLREKGYRP